MGQAKCTALVFAVLSGGAQAGGFAILTQSGSAVGTAYGGGAAAAEDASTVWYNPAGMANLPGTHVTLAAHGVRPSFEFRNTGSTGAFANPGTGEGGDGGSWNLVPQAYGTMRLTERWSAGVAINSPFGLKTQYDAGWRGQLTALKSDVRTYSVNPALAYRLSDALWVGAGLSVQRLTTELSNFAGPVAGTAVLAAGDTAYGYNFGAMFVTSPSSRLGIAYRSKISYRLSGTANFSGGGGALDSRIAADLTTPESVTASFYTTVGKDWEVMGGATWTRWDRIESIAVTRTSPSALAPAGSLVSALAFDWRNSTLYSIGVHYRPMPGWKLRAGLGYDPAVANDRERTARLPDQSRTMVTIGARYDVGKSGSIDLAYAHEYIKDAYVRNTVAGVPGALVGRFQNRADVVSVQYNHRF